MNTSAESSDNLYFLSGGGEMGELIRSTDWSKTSLGNPKSWPQSLRTAVAIMQDNPFGMYIAWGKEYIQLYNDGYRPILGTSKHPRALGISTRETFSEIWNIIEPMFDGVMQGKAVGFPDFMLPLNRNGFVEECYFDFSYSPIRKDDGEIGGVLVTIIETTTKKKAEDALKESEARFRAMADNIPNLAWMADAEGWIFWYNKKWYEYTGTTPDQMKGWGWQSVHDPETLPQVLEKWRKSIANGEKFEMVFPLKGADGKFRQFLTRVLPVLDKSEKITQWFGTNTDITLQIESEQKVKESEERFRKMAEALKETEQNLRNTILQSPVAMSILKGPDHLVELANERMFELWGKPAEVLLNKPIFEGLPEAKDQGFEAILNNVYTTGKAFIAEGIPVRLPRKNGIETVYVNLVYEPYRESDGSISGILVVAVDVTAQVIARRKIEEEVAKRTKELADSNAGLQTSNAELEQFAYIASHDLQEPLRKISTFTQMLEKKLGNNLDEIEKNYLKKINNSSARMTTLIRDVLAYSELSKQNDGFKEVPLDKIAADCITDFELLIEEKGATVQVRNLPVIEAIPLQMSQLFSNIIGNALKFARKNVKPVLSISAATLTEEEKKNAALDQSADYIKIQFSDNGIGFKQEYSEQIFNIFQRLHLKSEYEGTGIGLAICKKIVVNHRGELNAEGSSENGAVFNVILPLRK
ncbi:MAG: PAS domain S-box protein [Bacteroidota bacterium]|nr:PAS domain S-box protein [Bacteroidota bacterium]